MLFTVPKFIDEDPTVVGPFTFKQFLYVGGGIAIGFVFFYTLPMILFIPATVIVVGGGFILAFLKIESFSIPTLIKNFSFFSISTKIYLWKKKETIPKIIRMKKPKKKEKVAEDSTLKIAGKSQLKTLASRLERGEDLQE